MGVDGDRFGERGVHPLCDAVGLVCGCCGQQGGEFVTAEAPEQVVAAQDRGESGGDLDEQGVAHAVAVAVVDLLEAVEVDHQHGDGGGLGSGEQVGAALV